MKNLTKSSTLSVQNKRTLQTPPVQNGNSNSTHLMTFWDYLIISPLSTAAHAWPSAGNIVVPETAPALCYEAHRPIGVGGWGGITF